MNSEHKPLILCSSLSENPSAYHKRYHSLNFTAADDARQISGVIYDKPGSRNHNEGGIGKSVTFVTSADFCGFQT